MIRAEATFLLAMTSIAISFTLEPLKAYDHLISR